jgi:E3 ubiquitin-protein ligase RNF115/126
MYGNPGDYAFGRAGLDAIITQLLNQMDGTGPPPMDKDKISQIPTVEIDQQQVGQFQTSRKYFIHFPHLTQNPCVHSFFQNKICSAQFVGKTSNLLSQSEN